ncbi:MAG: penicillin-binding transpeptidase domain-containing protein [Gammaproteobacteria bacterium]|nr:penicillin-binding transpeptidase domain-containing protein [Gammaproteobacteria bacterium]
MNNKRFIFVIGLLILLVSIIIGRLFYLHVVDREFLLKQGNSRSLRTMVMPAERGIIFDRNNIPIAVSVPVSSIWVDPQYLQMTDPDWPKVLSLLNLNPIKVDKVIAATVKQADKKQLRFLYLARQIAPPIANQIAAFGIKGIYVQKEYRRYYPDSEVVAQVLGMTNDDNKGIAGVELKYNQQLAGKAGNRTIVRDLLGNVIDVPGNQLAPVPGQPLVLSIDRRLQYITYRALLASVQKNNAEAGMAIVVDVRTGEILAMTSVPSFNPNNRRGLDPDTMRNRVATDVFEPGSTIKPLAMVAILESGKVPLDTTVNTDPGFYTIGRNTVKDVHEYGTLTLTGIIQKSSNVGISKLVAQLNSKALANTLDQVGFGQVTPLKFPGERSGYVPHPIIWAPFALATLSFGYGMNSTALQLAQAYQAIANHGMQEPLTLLRLNAPPSNGKQVMPAAAADQVLEMLKSVVAINGTATKARVSGYEVAGKTGTSRKSVNGKYVNQYMGAFAGIIPANNPQLVMIVVIDHPRKLYYGGDVAAPVFADVMRQAVYLFKIPANSAHK